MVHFLLLLLLLLLLLMGMVFIVYGLFAVAHNVYIRRADMQRAQKLAPLHFCLGIISTKKRENMPKISKNLTADK